MKTAADEAIAFPANPFVALADFLILIILVLVLVLVQQSLISTGMLKRMAVEKEKQQLRAALKVGATGTVGIRQYYSDGDLQRFRIGGATCFDGGSAALKPAARAALARFGRLLMQRHGDDAAPGYGLFKRVEVHGNVDRGECPPDKTWGLSLRRAEAAARALMHGGLVSKVLVVSGRAEHDRAKAGRSPENRRVDIVIVYSAQRVMEYEERAVKRKRDASAE
jgi:flagellar motor protein MotB